MDELLYKRQREFRSVGLVLFVAASGLLVSRIISSLLSGVISDTALDAVFTLTMQVGFLLVGPWLVYTLYLKRNARGVLEFCNFRKVDWRVLLLCVPLGVCALIVTMGVSTIWYSILTMFGFSSSSSTDYPEVFSPALMLLELLLTAVLPGVCEEFTNRGGTVTVLRGSFGKGTTIVLAGVIFGLFHQNITQTFYTFLFGMLMALLVLETKSIFPGMIVHFLNNGLSVYLDYADAYKFLPLGGFFDAVNDMLVNNFGLALVLWLLFAAAGAGLVVAIVALSRRSRKKKSTPSEGIVITKVAGESVTEPPLENRVLYRPVLADWAFYIGALVMTAICSVLTFVWGLL